MDNSESDLLSYEVMEPCPLDSCRNSIHQLSIYGQFACTRPDFAWTRHDFFSQLPAFHMQSLDLAPAQNFAPPIHIVISRENVPRWYQINKVALVYV